MPFGRINAPATFQSYINDCLRPYIDDFAVCYLDDILIYSMNDKEHEEQVHQVLQRLKEFSRYCKAEKCQFAVSEVRFTGVCYHSPWSRHGIGPDLHNRGLADTKVI